MRRMRKEFRLRVRETEREREREKEIVPEREIDTVRTGIKEI